MKPKNCCSKSCCKKFWAAVGIVLLFIIAAPIGLVFSGPYICFMLMYECLDNRSCLPPRRNWCVRFWIIFFLLLIFGSIGFAADALTIPGLIIYGIVMGTYEAWKWCRANITCCLCCRRVPETANQRRARLRFDER